MVVMKSCCICSHVMLVSANPVAGRPGAPPPASWPWPRPPWPAPTDSSWPGPSPSCAAPCRTSRSSLEIQDIGGGREEMPLYLSYCHNSVQTTIDNKRKYPHFGILSPFGDILSSIGVINITGDWALLSNDNTAKEENTKFPIGQGRGFVCPSHLTIQLWV